MFCQRTFSNILTLQISVSVCCSSNPSMIKIYSVPPYLIQVKLGQCQSGVKFARAQCLIYSLDSLIAHQCALDRTRAGTFHGSRIALMSKSLAIFRARGAEGLRRDIKWHCCTTSTTNFLINCGPASVTAAQRRRNGQPRLHLTSAESSICDCSAARQSCQLAAAGSGALGCGHAGVVERQAEVIASCPGWHWLHQCCAATTNSASN